MEKSLTVNKLFVVGEGIDRREIAYFQAQVGIDYGLYSINISVIDKEMCKKHEEEFKVVFKEFEAEVKESARTICGWNI